MKNMTYFRRIFILYFCSEWTDFSTCGANGWPVPTMSWDSKLQSSFIKIQAEGWWKMSTFLLKFQLNQTECIISLFSIWEYKFCSFASSSFFSFSFLAKIFFARTRKTSNRFRLLCRTSFNRFVIRWYFWMISSSAETRVVVVYVWRQDENYIFSNILTVKMR